MTQSIRVGPAPPWATTRPEPRKIKGVPVFPSDPGVLRSPLTSGQVLAGALCPSLLVTLNCGPSYCGHPLRTPHLPAGVGGQSPAELPHVLMGRQPAASELQTPTCCSKKISRAPTPTCVTPWGLLQTPLPLDAGPHLSRLPFTTQAQPPSPDPRASQVTWRNGPQPRRSGSLPPPQSLVSPPELGPVVSPGAPGGSRMGCGVDKEADSTPSRAGSPPRPGRVQQGQGRRVSAWV